MKYRQFWHKTLNYSKTMKDMNFVEINKYTGNSLIDLNDIENDQINTIIQNDQRFLTSEGLMDYSLLLVRETLQK
jgi:hypothetical protein